MTEAFDDWLNDLRARRQRWVDASHENNFDRGIWNATVEKYADPSHFIFELLQNAEDAEATWVRFSLATGYVLFEHDGRPFDRDDIEGITGIGNTTKLDDGHKIGCFGIGFKSVYVITERPEVHCTIEGQPMAFAIENLVVPGLIETQHRGSTTRIMLPLRPERAELALTRAREGLAGSGARSLLFLRNIKRLEWIDRDAGGEVEVDDRAEGIRSIRSRLPDRTTRQDRFLILAKPVSREGEEDVHDVRVAFRLNDGGEIVPEDAPTRLVVFFETEETTGLHFLIHGPFQLTDNRANIKRDDPWNATLIAAIAGLVADALPDFRDRGLLKRSFLDILPNPADELPPAFAPILEAIADKFREEPLIPAHGGGYATAIEAIRGPVELRDLFGDQGLAEFAHVPGRRWISMGLKNRRAEAFLAMLGIEEWGYAEFFSAFQRAFTKSQFISAAEADARQQSLSWFAGLADEYVQRFYLAIEAAMKLQKRASVSHLMFVRLEDGRRCAPTIAFLAPKDSALDSEGEGSELYLVKKSLVRSGRGRGTEVEAFLRRVGVKDVDEKAYLAAIIRTQYQGKGARPNGERHLKHMRRFIRWWKDHRDASLFSGVPFLRVESKAGFHEAGDVYLGEPYLRSALGKIYDGSIEGRDKRALWTGYAKLTRKEFLPFLAACGVEDRLWILPSRISWAHPHYNKLLEGFAGARNTSTGTNLDFSIDEIDDLLARGDADISRMIWDAVRANGASVMAASFAPNQSHSANRAPSTLALALREAAWIPAKGGRLKVPREMTAAELAQGYAVGGNDAWLLAIGFGEDSRQRSEQHKERRKAGELIGLTPELVDKLQDLPPDALAALNEEVMRKISSQAYQTTEFPERVSRNPERRAERLGVRAAAAPLKTYEVRERSVRVSNTESRGLARTYLADHYTNDADEMVCQACHEKMPFRLPDGSPYFEACELLEMLEGEQAENHLAMCPTCAAKWRYATAVTDAELRSLLATAISPEIQVVLAGEMARLRFTQVHLDDIRTVGGIAVPP